MENIFEKIKELCGYREIVIKYGYTRDGGHGDMVNQILIMLTHDGENPYYILDGKFTTYEEINGYECALLYCDTNLEDMLNDFYNFLKEHLK